MEPSPFILAAAYGADLVFGDPRWLPHPVRGMGWLIQTGEALVRRLVPWERLAGGALVLAVVGICVGATVGLLEAIRSWPVAYWAVSAFLLYTCLSTRDLDVESRAVWRALAAGDLVAARRQVAMIVGRDTDRLDEPGVVRATLETIAESTMDGIAAPFFYAVLAGVPGAVAYKAINTLDSMIGYRSARYLRFGSVAAWVDTVANWIPAHLTAWLILLAACLKNISKKSARHFFGELSKKSARHFFPRLSNSEIAEAAMAEALGVELGGVNWYQGRPVEGQRLGVAERPLAAERILEAIRVMYLASFLACLTAMTVLVMRTS